MARELAIENGKLKSDLDANGNGVKNLAAPVSDNDAATKKYVDERPVPTPSWSDITGKPTEFPPEAHTHTKSEITDFPTSMPPTAHSHASDSWFTTAIKDVKLWAKSLLPDWLTPSREEPPTWDFVLSVENEANNARDAAQLAENKAESALVHADEALAGLDGKANASDFSTSTPASYVTDFVKKSVRYQTHAIGSDGAVANYAFNTLTMTGDKTLAFPTVAAGDPPRDFLLVVTYTSGSLTLPSGFTYYGDAVSMEANATYLFAFTEVKSGEFYRRVIKMEVPNA